jgi:sulfite exporter TauE/SafE
MLYGSVEIKSSTENVDELLELKCQAQRTIREMFIFRAFDSVSQITEATLLYFDQAEELQCSALNGNSNEGLVPSEQVTSGGESIISEESSDEGFLTTGALVGLSFLGGTLIAAMVVGIHYKHTQRNARRNVNLTEEDLSMIIADV